MHKIINILKLIRIHQIQKNIFVLLPLIFSKGFTDSNKIILALLAAFSFYLISALIYVINDYKDIESDKLHPKKKNRPLASGLVSKLEAKILITFLILVNAIVFFLWSNIIEVTIVLSIFFINNIFYNFLGKRIAYIDITQNAFGYVLRVLAGSFAINVTPTFFLLSVTFLLTFAISLGKRIREMMLYGKKARKSLENYNLQITKQLFQISIITLNIIYLLYTTITTEQSRLIILSVPFFILLSFNFYNTILNSKKDEDDPSLVFLKNKFNFSLSIISIILVIIIITFG